MRLPRSDMVLSRLRRPDTAVARIGSSRVAIRRFDPQFRSQHARVSGFGQARMTPAVDPQTRQPYTIAKDGFRSTYYEMVGQYGTHVDPPAHFAEDGITMDRIPLKQMILPLVVFDATRFSSRILTTRSRSTICVRGKGSTDGCRRGAFAALRTDMYKDWNSDPERFKRSPFRPGRSRPSSSWWSSAA